MDPQAMIGPNLDTCKRGPTLIKLGVGSKQWQTHTHTHT